MNLKNNLFNYATSELSQDAFLCWLASYALEDAEPDDTLRSCAREMLELFVPEFNVLPFTLTDVERQVWHIDALLASDLSRGLFSFRDKICPHPSDNHSNLATLPNRPACPKCRPMPGGQGACEERWET